jgi:hypothetical protein
MINGIDIDSDIKRFITGSISFKNNYTNKEYKRCFVLDDRNIHEEFRRDSIRKMVNKLLSEIFEDKDNKMCYTGQSNND